jgi:hypothetical protein
MTSRDNNIVNDNNGSTGISALSKAISASCKAFLHEVLVSERFIIVSTANSQILKSLESSAFVNLCETSYFIECKIQFQIVHLLYARQFTFKH